MIEKRICKKSRGIGEIVVFYVCVPKTINNFLYFYDFLDFIFQQILFYIQTILEKLYKYTARSSVPLLFFTEEIEIIDILKIVILGSHPIYWHKMVCGICFVEMLGKI